MQKKLFVLFINTSGKQYYRRFVKSDLQFQKVIDLGNGFVLKHSRKNSMLKPSQNKKLLAKKNKFLTKYDIDIFGDVLIFNNNGNFYKKDFERFVNYLIKFSSDNNIKSKSDQLAELDQDILNLQTILAKEKYTFLFSYFENSLKKFLLKREIILNN